MADRRDAERRWRGAETLAALWLLAKGYRILAQRERTPYGEIDIAAFKGGVLVIVEVKARPSFAEGMFAVTPNQRDRLFCAAQEFARRRRLGAVSIRFDVMVREPGRWPRHVRGAWRVDDWSGGDNGIFGDRGSSH